MHNNSYDRFKELKFNYCDGRQKMPTQGDALLMQLINTKRSRGTVRAKDYLQNYWDFLIWALEVKLIGQQLFDELFLESYANEKEAAAVLRDVIAVRDSMYDFLLAFMEQRPVLPGDFKTLNRLNATANNNLHFVMTDYGPRRVWINVKEELAAPLWAVVKHTAELIVTEDLLQVTMCECGSMFIDRSKRKTRLWCCKTCATCYWSRTYYGRKKEAISGFTELKVEIIETNSDSVAAEALADEGAE